MTAKPNEPHLGLVVEGRGELDAIPVLLRKLFQRRGIHRDLLGKPVQCLGRDNALKEGGIEGKVATAAARPGCRAVLVVLDGEGDAVCERGPDLLLRAREGAQGKPVVVCLAENKYEDWLIASAETLGLPLLQYQPGRGSISLLREALYPGKYIKPVLQPRLSAVLDLDLAADRNASFARLLQRTLELYLQTELADQHEQG